MSFIKKYHNIKQDAKNNRFKQHKQNNNIVVFHYHNKTFKQKINN